jgi:hypothetical protein
MEADEIYEELCKIAKEEADGDIHIACEIMMKRHGGDEREYLDHYDHHQVTNKSW